ncbi:MAG: B12-binding domain-containing radical SAM protein [Planctomycetes bacterium]|nr:B12-binding domain-containing radical SAM protein [Planctomycetota bacterium]
MTQTANFKVALVTPPSIFLLDQRVFPNLGILKVASCLEAEGYSVDLLDFSGIENYLDALRDYLNSHQLKAIGITVTTPQMPSAGRIIQTIRETQPDLKIIMGGPHVTLVASAWKLEKKANRVGRGHHAFEHLKTLVDILVAGDGERAIISALQDDSDWFVDGDEPSLGLFMSKDDYEKTPWPARHLIDLKSYRYHIEGHKSTSLIAQLGCPFHCGFCGGRHSKSLRNIRTRSSESIISEIEFLHKEYGYTGFMFYDDELNVNKKMVELMQQTTKLQKKYNTEFRLRGFVKAELFTQEQADAMFEAGFRWLLSGFESGSPRILTNIEKRATQEDNTNAIEIAKKAGLKVKALMSVGHPGESAQTITDTKNWLLKVKPDDFDCTVITTYPGTPYYDLALPHESREGIYTFTSPKTGDRLHSHDLDYTKVEDYYKGDPKGGYRAYVYTDHLKEEEIVKLRDEVEETVRKELCIPFNPGSDSVQYEHSMGMGKGLPDFILRSSSS